MCRAAERYDRKDTDCDGEERRKVKRQRRNAEQYAAQELRRDDEKLFGTKDFQKRTPKELNRPRPHDKRCPKRDLCVRNPQVLVQNNRNHVQDHKRKTHRKIKRRNPFQRRVFRINKRLHNTQIKGC